MDLGRNRLSSIIQEGVGPRNTVGVVRGIKRREYRQSGIVCEYLHIIFRAVQTSFSSQLGRTLIWGSRISFKLRQRFGTFAGFDSPPRLVHSARISGPFLIIICNPHICQSVYPFFSFFSCSPPLLKSFMDSLQFDAYTPSYSGSSAPRTPSPLTSSSDEMQPYTNSPANFKQPLDIDTAHNIFAEYQGDDSVVVPETHSIEPAPFWSGVHSSPAAQYANRGSLLQELYEHDIPHDQPSAQEMFLDQHSVERPSSGHSDWSQMSHEQNMHMQAQQQQQQQLQHHSQVHMHRRNTFPIVRHDRDTAHGNHPFFNPSLVGGGDHGSAGPFSRSDSIYGQPMPLSAEPSVLQGNEPFLHSMSSSPRGSFREFDHLEDGGVKLEDAPPVIVPSQTAFYRPSSGGGMHPMSMSYLSPHTGLPVQHTDDAASKETQYLRRRCFNCHTTEPPSWRRSTLNPGKIVCNKCGLYERTHLRPRPLRFDELRAGNKARKQSKTVVGSQSPKQKMGGLVKKEPREFVGLARRSSVSSTSSSVHSGTGATSDWDDNGALRVIMYRRRTLD